MTEYIVRYVNKDKNHKTGSYLIVATDVKHAMQQCQELAPDARITSVLPADEWND